MHFVAAEACQEEALPSTKVQQYSTSNLVMQSKLPIPTWDYVGLLHIQYNYVQDSEGYYETDYRAIAKCFSKLQSYWSIYYTRLCVHMHHCPNNTLN